MIDVLLVGCGYSGARIAAFHLERGDRVVAITRRGKSGIQGVRDVQLDLDTPRIPALPRAGRLYYIAPPPDSGTRDSRIARVLAALPPPEFLLYFGTTGVYGNHSGARVDETASLKPATDRARRRLDAENRVRTWSDAHGVTAAILRIAGIYGPGRLPLDRLRTGAAAPDPADTGPGNRVHVDDLAAAALAIADTNTPGTWNVSDGNPLSVADFNDLVADAAGLSRPRRVPLDSPEISPGLRGFLRDSRRIDNRKLLSVPGFTLRYADPFDGILASMADMFDRTEENGR